ncbi:MAG: glycosyl transferase family 4 [Euryarchaeota archaeon HGW-Euryarchaeota-1]|nr:MAG: glycosyl transferase family 4 [Euryarchaeota archaeon HGW-Euryarchaeota-1]
MLAILVTVLIITIVGFADDILGWKIGLKQWQKPLLTLPAAVPIMVINAGTSTMNLPLFGVVDLGLIYPLFLVPLAIVGTANGFNMLAGHNGLEAGLGAIILSFLGYVAWVSGLGWLALVVFAMVAALLGFLVFNWYPAKVFPGDTLTYSVGALIGVVAIMGNMEKIAIILFIPFFIELLLKARYKFKTENYCTPNKNNNTLCLPNGKIYSVCHLSLASLLKINKNLATERNLVLLIYFVEILLVFVCIFLYLI